MNDAPTTAAPRIAHRHHPKRRRPSLLSSGRAAGSSAFVPAAAGGAGTVPHLLMAEPEDHRRSFISGSITTLLHAAVLGLLVLLAWLAPPVEQLIEVRIIRELPGSDAVPAPARKLIQPRRQRAPVQAARQVTAQAVAQPRVVNVAPQQLQMNQLNQAVAPQAVQRRQVVSNRTEARSIDTRAVTSNVDLSNLQNVAVVPTDLSAPIVDTDGPREIDPGAALQAPQDFADVPDVADVDYSSAAPGAVVTDQSASSDLEVYDFDTDVGVYAGGEGTGGTGTSVGTVPCMQSGFVHRYLALVTDRTEQRWRVPEGIPEDTKVVLRFVLDASGTATQVEFVGDVPPTLGNSAIAALRSASPFPPMDDSVRCLAGKKLSGTFSVESL